MRVRHNIDLMNETTLWRRLCSQNTSHAYSTPSKPSAILCVLLNRVCKNRDFFLVQRNFPLYTQGLLGCLLGFWPSWPKHCGGNKAQSNTMINETLKVQPVLSRGIQAGACTPGGFLKYRVSKIAFPAFRE